MIFLGGHDQPCGIAPVIGGVLDDRVASVAIWYGGLLMGLTAAGLMLLERRLKPQQQAKLTV